jgi:hypothetical protein
MSASIIERELKFVRREIEVQIAKRDLLERLLFMFEAEEIAKEQKEAQP